MTKEEFLTELNKALSGTGLERENIRYYSDYIDSRMAEGLSEEAVLEELGSPRLIARSVKDAAGLGDYGQNTDFQSCSGQNVASQGADRTAGKEQGTDRGLYSTQKAGLVLILILVLLLIFLLLAFRIIGGIFVFLSPVLIPVLIIYAIVRMFRRR